MIEEFVQNTRLIPLHLLEPSIHPSVLPCRPQPINTSPHTKHDLTIDAGKCWQDKLYKHWPFRKKGNLKWMFRNPKFTNRLTTASQTPKSDLLRPNGSLLLVWASLLAGSRINWFTHKACTVWTLKWGDQVAKRHSHGENEWESTRRDGAVTELSSSERCTERKSHKERDLNGERKAFNGKIDIFRLGTDYQYNKTFCCNTNRHKATKKKFTDL